MLYHLSLWLSDYIHGLQVVHYVSFRIVASLITAVLGSLLLGDWFIGISQKLFRASRRIHTPDSHEVKNGTPSMGGIFICSMVLLSTLLWCNLTHTEVWLLIGIMITFGAIGLWDDLFKIWYKKGISERAKFVSQLGAGTLFASLWYFYIAPTTALCIPFVKQWQPELGWLIVPWTIFIMLGASNAVNLTDGLDGLAIGTLLTNFTTYGVIAYLAGHALFAQYLQIPYAATSEVAIITSALIGASLGFLWFNAYPAQIFMGDVGSLALGALLGMIAVMTRQELLLPIAGGIFVLETVSVIVQVLSYRFTGKRIFRMAPIHHHFELSGWQESKITTRCAIISIMLCLCALVTLKIR